MYELVHVPTNIILGRFKTVAEVLTFLKENPGYTRSDLVANFYQLIETIKLG